jgi:septal ring factor EnvC (AmiA/AmiB activator)
MSSAQESLHQEKELIELCELLIQRIDALRRSEAAELDAKTRYTLAAEIRDAESELSKILQRRKQLEQRRKDLETLFAEERTEEGQESAADSSRLTKWLSILKSVGVEASAAAVVTTILALLGVLADLTALGTMLSDLFKTTGPLISIVAAIVSVLGALAATLNVATHLYGLRERRRELEIDRLREREEALFSGIEADITNLLAWEVT